MLQIALKIESVNTARGRNEAEVMLREQKGKTFDPQLTDVFLEVTRQTELWEKLAKNDLWEEVLDLEPDSPYRNMAEPKLDVVALAAADFVDLKSPLTVNHSRETARIAEGIAHRMGLSPVEVTDIRRAGLVHDLGLIALPGHILLPQSQLSEVDHEKLRLQASRTTEWNGLLPWSIRERIAGECLCSRAGG
jgi:HD-GYP domain-containing protein (c-di-GMP phosphodiesterase class II)